MARLSSCWPGNDSHEGSEPGAGRITPGWLGAGRDRTGAARGSDRSGHSICSRRWRRATDGIGSANRSWTSAARTRDLCLVPTIDMQDGQRSVAEAVIFGSGRPVLVYRPGKADLLGKGISTVIVAWDGSRSTARALGDALPLLPQAHLVRVRTVLKDKVEVRTGIGAEVVRHLAAHGVDAVADEVDADGRETGQVLADYAVQHHSDLLVMGAFGRSGVRDFILGGATELMLDEPTVPLLLSY